MDNIYIIKYSNSKGLVTLYIYGVFNVNNFFIIYNKSNFFLNVSKFNVTAKGKSKFIYYCA